MKLKTLLFCSLLAIGFVSCGGDDNDDNENGSGSTSTEVINGHKFVNLGLPSGTLWAETNVGAKSKSDIGDYYAWGELETKETYTEENSTWANTKYNYEFLLPADDVATQKWGIGVHMPSHYEAQELVDNCEFTWTTVKGQKGYKITGKNGNHIFLPAGGYKNKSEHRLSGLECDYWTSSPAGYGGARQICFDSRYMGTEDEFHIMGSCNPYNGLLIRPVASK